MANPEHWRPTREIAQWLVVIGTALDESTSLLGRAPTLSACIGLLIVVDVLSLQLLSACYAFRLRPRVV